jgi:hypothetical protein
MSNNYFKCEICFVIAQYTVDRHIQMAGIDTVYGHGTIVHSLLFLVALVPMVYIVISTSMFD